LTSCIIIYASLLDFITCGPGYTLKISKKMNFLTPSIFLRTEGHVRSYEGDSDSSCRVVVHMFFLLGLPWLKYLFDEKKNTIFDPVKVLLFSEQCDFGIFWYSEKLPLLWGKKSCFFSFAPKRHLSQSEVGTIHMCKYYSPRAIRITIIWPFWFTFYSSRINAGA
jgi:hypothetical protein